MSLFLLMVFARLAYKSDDTPYVCFYSEPNMRCDFLFRSDIQPAKQNQRRLCVLYVVIVTSCA